MKQDLDDIIERYKYREGWYDNDNGAAVVDQSLQDDLTKKDMKKYVFWKVLLKTLVRGLLLVGPAAIPLLPAAWMDLSVGAVLVLLFDWLRIRYTQL